MRSIVYIAEYLSLDNIIRPLNAKHNKEKMEKKTTAETLLCTWEKGKKIRKVKTHSHNGTKTNGIMRAYSHSYLGLDVRARARVYVRSGAQRIVRPNFHAILIRLFVYVDDGVWWRRANSATAALRCLSTSHSALGPDMLVPVASLQCGTIRRRSVYSELWYRKWLQSTIR